MVGVVFNKEGYDPFIDFIKAYAIICVLIGHTIPHPEYYGYGLWAGMQVPLFVLVQSFHSLKRDTVSFSFRKIFWRLFFPFIIIQSFTFAILLASGYYDSSFILREYVAGGGYGPGSYFPWIYLQMAIILSLVSGFIKRGSLLKNTIWAFVICEGFEIISSVISLPEDLHRLLAIRYLFLIYLGWLWVKTGIVINWKTISLSLLSMMSIIYFEYYSINNEPLFYNTLWSIHRWPCYYYVAILGVFLLKKLYDILCRNTFLINSIRLLARCSYEIFLLQMAIIAIFPIITFIPSGYFRLFVRISSVFIFSIWGGYLLNVYYTKFLNKKLLKK